jgi:hypothetical protein
LKIKIEPSKVALREMSSIYWLPRLGRIALVVLVFLIAGCVTSSTSGVHSALINSPELRQRTAAEPAGPGFVGRRMYVNGFSFWGYVKRPGQPWPSAKLVMLNEQQRHAPDRQLGALGKDNGAEYLLTGRYSGDWIYEAASGRFFPEFILTGYQLLDRQPPPIFPQGFVERRDMFLDWPQGTREPGW